MVEGVMIPSSDDEDGVRERGREVREFGDGESVEQETKSLHQS